VKPWVQTPVLPPPQPQQQQKETPSWRLSILALWATQGVLTSLEYPRLVYVYAYMFVHTFWDED
jgi:hypothetical protein